MTKRIWLKCGRQAGRVFLIFGACFLVMNGALGTRLFADKPPRDAISELLMPVPDEIAEQNSFSSASSYGCRENYDCGTGQACVTDFCRPEDAPTAKCGKCLDTFSELETDTRHCRPDEVKIQSGAGTYSCAPAKDYKCRNCDLKCDESTRYECIDPCAKDSVEGTSWNGSACVCSNGKSPVNGSCQQILDLKASVTEVCRASGNYESKGSGCVAVPTSSCLSGYATMQKETGVVVQIDQKTGKETATTQACQLTNAKEVVDSCCDSPAIACPGNSVTDPSKCSDCYREVSGAAGCYECGTLQSSTAPKKYSATCAGYSSSLSSCPNSCGWAVEETAAKTTYSCPSGYQATKSFESTGGEVSTVYCCAPQATVNTSQCWYGDSLIAVSGSTCDMTTGTDSMTTASTVTINCGSGLGGSPGAELPASAISGGKKSGNTVYPNCVVTPCTTT